MVNETERSEKRMEEEIEMTRGLVQDDHLAALQTVKDAVEDDRVVVGEVRAAVEPHLHTDTLGRACEVAEVETDDVRPQLVLRQE